MITVLTFYFTIAAAFTLIGFWCGNRTALKVLRTERDAWHAALDQVRETVRAELVADEVKHALHTLNGDKT